MIHYRVLDSINNITANKSITSARENRMIRKKCQAIVLCQIIAFTSLLRDEARQQRISFHCRYCYNFVIRLTKCIRHSVTDQSNESFLHVRKASSLNGRELI